MPPQRGQIWPSLTSFGRQWAQHVLYLVPPAPEPPRRPPGGPRRGSGALRGLPEGVGAPGGSRRGYRFILIFYWSYFIFYFLCRLRHFFYFNMALKTPFYFPPTPISHLWILFVNFFGSSILYFWIAEKAYFNRFAFARNVRTFGNGLFWLFCNFFAKSDRHKFGSNFIYFVYFYKFYYFFRKIIFIIKTFCKFLQKIVKFADSGGGCLDRMNPLRFGPFGELP